MSLYRIKGVAPLKMTLVSHAEFEIPRIIVTETNLSFARSCTPALSAMFV